MDGEEAIKPIRRDKNLQLQWNQNISLIKKDKTGQVKDRNNTKHVSWEEICSSFFDNPSHSCSPVYKHEHNQ